MAINRIYLRASTDEQDSNRERDNMLSFTTDKFDGAIITYTENYSGTKLQRPELAKLLDELQEGDRIIIEKVDRITRMTMDDWDKLKRVVKEKGAYIVSVDQPMTHQQADNPLMEVLTNFILDIGAAMSREWWETMKKRQRQGIEREQKADAERPDTEKKYKGKQPDVKLRSAIKGMLLDGAKQVEITAALKCSPKVIVAMRKELKEAGKL
ncbi:recombinase family protein [Enterovibrio baiacu]|uniref:recombinase family protein n=1 Tax=Enterovibrio baiacu TaxID=2491023 RepID=UPI0010139C91|nr:recombinase family protein [Enterovibrio baiacu]MBE1275084.1 resolvase [Enterovibrio baiacu]